MLGKGPLGVSSSVHGDHTHVYRLSGSLHGSTESYAFQDEVRGRIAAGAAGIVLDLSAVERIDSSGIGILVALMFSAHKAGARFILSAVGERVRKALGLALLLDHIEQAESVDAALGRLRG